MIADSFLSELDKLAAEGRFRKEALIGPAAVAIHQLATGDEMKRHQAAAAQAAREGRKYHPVRTTLKRLGLGALGFGAAALARELIMGGGGSSLSGSGPFTGFNRSPFE